jgi:hypothetical protein
MKEEKKENDALAIFKSFLEEAEEKVKPLYSYNLIIIDVCICCTNW